MKPRSLARLLVVSALLTATTACIVQPSTTDLALGRVEVKTLPWDPALDLRTATYTPSGKVLAVYNQTNSAAGRHVNLATLNDDGSDMRTFFSGIIPHRDKDNGIRYMVFPDNQRIFLGDFVIECETSLETCEKPELVPVQYPAVVADGDHISHRWSEMIVAPDNRHVAWTTLFADYSAMMFTGKLQRQKDKYSITEPLIISTLESFREDPEHLDGVIPNSVRNGEVKQFVHGGTGISLVGAVNRDTADSVVQNLVTGELTQITDTPGYNETTIFSPDEKLGITMTSRFSQQTNLAILGLMPRPYPASLNMGLNMHTYIYSVAGVRQARSGNIGPALIEIAASKAGGDYRGVNLNTSADWVYHSPMSWHPGGKKAMWLEGLRGQERKRIQVVHLPDYEPGPPVAAQALAQQDTRGSDDLTLVRDYIDRKQDTAVKVYGRHSGHIDYRHSASGLIEKTYVNFSDDGEQVYKGSESMRLNPRGFTTYQADVTLSGTREGTMKLQLTFGPIKAELPARLVFDKDESGQPLSHGYVRYAGKRLDVSDLSP